MLAGGHSEVKTDADGLATISSFKGIIEAHLNASYTVFEPVHYTTQVVAGTVYQAKIRVNVVVPVDTDLGLVHSHEGENAEIMVAEAGKSADEAFNFE
eukprot:CAMPEP_0168346724 /NCGR_PEP_ID=MMETSP0213-20121227/18491_1 /TAXON_ID=151035 /ORGANISM="Euplotes harpa, Strain FSP1.4" /LENGTH=97 /DNA_ID=CAMNT_0008355529 /DNA_START=27 /DNA_END=317 /DNA_ORIENTATION=+